MGIVVLLTRDPQLSQSIFVVERITNSYWIRLLMSLLGYAWSIWIVVSGNDWMFGYLMNVSGVHTAGRPCVMACRSQTSWEGFPLSWKWGFGWNTIRHFEMSHLHCMFGSNMSEMAWIMSVRHVQIWNVKRKQIWGLGLLVKPGDWKPHRQS